MDKSNITIRFEGQSHAIDANTLVNMLIHCKGLIDAIDAERGGGRGIRMDVNAIERGSFVIDLSLAGNAMRGLFSSGAIGHVADVATILGLLLDLFSRFRGRRMGVGEAEAAANEINVAVNNVRVSETVVNIYNGSAPAREAVGKMFETANDDGYVDGVTFGCGGRTVAFTKGEFPEIISNMADSDILPGDREEERDATLNVLGLRFEPGGRWQFMYDGGKISATIGAERLMEAIDGGERFGKGDALRVRLRIVKRFSKEYNCYVNASFRITEYYEHIKAGETGDLFRDQQA